MSHFERLKRRERDYLRGTKALLTLCDRIRAYCPDAFDLSAHLDTLGRPPRQTSQGQEYALQACRRSAAALLVAEPTVLQIDAKTGAAQHVPPRAPFHAFINADEPGAHIDQTSAGCEGLDLKWVKQVHIHSATLDDPGQRVVVPFVTRDAS
jgi:hypothetical protein